MQLPYMTVGTVALMFLVGCDKPQQKSESRSETAAVPKTDLVKSEPVAKEEKKRKNIKVRLRPRMFEKSLKRF